jgi:YbbR domain-containing protein
MTEQNPMSEGTYTVPIEVNNLATKYIVSDVPETVMIRLKAPRNTIIGITTADIKAYIDLSEVEAGKVKTPVHLLLPKNTELMQQSLTQADVLVDVYMVKEFTLTPHVTGKMERDISVQAVKCSPERVTISGAERLINEIEQATIGVPMQGKRENFSFMAPIRLMNKEDVPVEGLTITPKQTNVSVSIVHNAVHKQVPVRIITYGDVASGMVFKQVVVVPATVGISGLKELVQTINYINVPPIDLTGLSQTTERELTLPAVDGIVTEPEKVKIRLELEDK